MDDGVRAEAEEESLTLDDPDSGLTLSILVDEILKREILSYLQIPEGELLLNAQQQMLIEQRLTNSGPSTAVAYLLLIFLGMFGAHRFYLGRTGSAIAQLILTITFFGMIISGVWVFIDLFLIPGMIREKQDAERQRLTVQMMANPV